MGRIVYLDETIIAVVHRQYQLMNHDPKKETVLRYNAAAQSAGTHATAAFIRSHFCVAFPLFDIARRRSYIPRDARRSRCSRT